MLMRIMTIDGRATRSEFWMVHFFSYLFLITGMFFFSNPVVKIPLNNINSGLALFLFIILFCLCIASQIFVGIRRMHDLNTGFWACGITLIPFVGFVIYFLSAGFLKGNPGDNRYGPNPDR